MKDYSKINPLNIGGNMSKEGADKAGLILAKAISVALLVFSVAALIYAVKWW